MRPARRSARVVDRAISDAPRHQSPALFPAGGAAVEAARQCGSSPALPSFSGRRAHAGRLVAWQMAGFAQAATNFWNITCLMPEALCTHVVWGLLSLTIRGILR